MAIIAIKGVYARQREHEGVSPELANARPSFRYAPARKLSPKDLQGIIESLAVCDQPRERQAIMLMRYEQRSATEAAKLMRCPVPAVAEIAAAVEERRDALKRLVEREAWLAANVGGEQSRLANRIGARNGGGKRRQTHAAAREGSRAASGSVHAAGKLCVALVALLGAMLAGGSMASGGGLAGHQSFDSAINRLGTVPTAITRQLVQRVEKAAIDGDGDLKSVGLRRFGRLSGSSILGHTGHDGDTLHNANKILLGGCNAMVNCPKRNCVLVEHCIASIIKSRSPALSIDVASELRELHSPNRAEAFVMSKQDYVMRRRYDGKCEVWRTRDANGFYVVMPQSKNGEIVAVVSASALLPDHAARQLAFAIGEFNDRAHSKHAIDLHGKPIAHLDWLFNRWLFPVNRKGKNIGTRRTFPLARFERAITQAGDFCHSFHQMTQAGLASGMDRFHDGIVPVLIDGSHGCATKEVAAFLDRATKSGTLTLPPTLKLGSDGSKVAGTTAAA